jgi:hypothetical protein
VLAFDVGRQRVFRLAFGDPRLGQLALCLLDFPIRVVGVFFGVANGFVDVVPLRGALDPEGDDGRRREDEDREGNEEIEVRFGLFAPQAVAGLGQRFQNLRGGAATRRRRDPRTAALRLIAEIARAKPIASGLERSKAASSAVTEPNSSTATTGTRQASIHQARVNLVPPCGRGMRRRTDSRSRRRRWATSRRSFAPSIFALRSRPRCEGGCPLRGCARRYPRPRGRLRHRVRSRGASCRGRAGPGLHRSHREHARRPSSVTANWPSWTNDRESGALDSR